MKTANHQIIHDSAGRPAFVVIPYADYVKTNEANLSDEALFDGAMSEAGNFGPTVPHSVMTRLVSGEHPVKVFREWRGMTQAELAEEVGFSEVYIGAIERGTRRLSSKVRAVVAEALTISADMLD